MSEYQYYEFQALDKPLTRQQQKELRSLPSRAEITATSFVNEYNYGDFRGEPQKLMGRYFDAFCYLANWGTRRLMFRLPKTVLDARTARRYCHSDAASVTETADHVIIDLCLERDPDDEWLEGSGLLAGMVQARSDLAAGDLRLRCEEYQRIRPRGLLAARPARGHQAPRASGAVQQARPRHPGALLEQARPPGAPRPHRPRSTRGPPGPPSMVTPPGATWASPRNSAC